MARPHECVVARLRCDCRRAGSLAWLQGVGPQRTRDILETLLTEISEGRLQLVAHLPGMRSAIPVCTSNALRTASTTLPELDDRAILRAFDDPPAMQGSCRID